MVRPAGQQRSCQAGMAWPGLITENCWEVRGHGQGCETLGLVSEPAGAGDGRTAWFQIEGPGLDLKCCGILVS